VLTLDDSITVSLQQGLQRAVREVHCRGGRSYFLRLWHRSCFKIFQSMSGSGNLSN